MEITEVRIKLMDDPHDRLRAFCSLTFDACFVIRDLKIIQGAKGAFVAMPSRKLTDRCPRCYAKNHLRAVFCTQCGAKLDEERAVKDSDGRAKLYADIAHPINSDCREMIQRKVIESFEEELVRSQQPGYVCTYDDYGEDRFARLDGEEDYDEDAPKVVAQKRDGGNTHRMEKAESGPAAPHVGVAGPHGRRQSKVASPSNGQSEKVASDDDEGFGAGLV